MRILVAGLIGGLAMFLWGAVSHTLLRFPLDFTLGTLVGQMVGWTVAGAAIAWWLGRKRGLAD